MVSASDVLRCMAAASRWAVLFPLVAFPRRCSSRTRTASTTWCSCNLQNASRLLSTQPPPLEILFTLCPSFCSPVFRAPSPFAFGHRTKHYITASALANPSSTLHPHHARSNLHSHCAICNFTSTPHFSFHFTSLHPLPKQSCFPPFLSHIWSFILMPILRPYRFLPSCTCNVLASISKRNLQAHPSTLRPRPFPLHNCTSSTSSQKTFAMGVAITFLTSANDSSRFHVGSHYSIPLSRPRSW